MNYLFVSGKPTQMTINGTFIVNKEVDDSLNKSTDPIITRLPLSCNYID